MNIDLRKRMNVYKYIYYIDVFARVRVNTYIQCFDHFIQLTAHYDRSKKLLNVRAWFLL